MEIAAPGETRTKKSNNPSGSVISGGGAGKSEADWMRTLENDVSLGRTTVTMLPSSAGSDVTCA